MNDQRCVDGATITWTGDGCMNWKLKRRDCRHASRRFGKNNAPFEHDDANRKAKQQHSRPSSLASQEPAGHTKSDSWTGQHSTGSRTMTDDRIFYGPHPCKECGKIIAKASHQQGGESFDYPEGPIYPNTDWNRHACVTQPDATPIDAA